MTRSDEGLFMIIVTGTPKRAPAEGKAQHTRFGHQINNFSETSDDLSVLCYVIPAQRFFAAQRLERENPIPSLGKFMT
jgi:hypothetical protein